MLITFYKAIKKERFPIEKEQRMGINGNKHAKQW